jgi:hypothetical protein
MMDSEPTEAAGTPEAPPTMAADPAAEGETQSINAWSLADDGASTEITPFQQRSWKIPAVVAAVAIVLATCIGVGVWEFSQHGRPAPVPTHRAAPPPLSVTAPPPTPVAPPARHVGARMVDHNLQLDGEPKDWTVIENDLQQQGITIDVNAVGVVTHLQFADDDTAPGNWVRWYAKHVPSAAYHPGPSQPVAFLVADEAGLPVPPPPEICYAGDGSAIPIGKFPGPYVNCGPTPGSIAGH